MWLKNFRQRKLQTFLTVIIILLCALFLSTSLSILLSLNEPMERLVEECESAFAVVYPYSDIDSEVEDVAERLRGLDEIEKAICTRGHYIFEEMTSNGRSVITFTNLTEYKEEVFGKVRCVEGNREEFADLAEDECIVPASVCVANELKVGDPFVIHMPNKDYSYTIKGIYADIYATSNAFDNYILVKEIPKEMESKLRIRIYVRDGVTEEQILDSYEKKYGNGLEGQINSKENALAGSLLAIQILGGILLAVGAMMLFTSCLIINFIVRNTLTEDAKNIAIYKTIGYDYNTIRDMYMKFYAVLTTAGAVAGLVGAKLVADYILSELFANIGEQADVRIGLTGLVLYAAIMLLVLGTVYAVVSKTRKIKPIYALSGMSPTDTAKMQNYKKNYRFAFSPLGIAARTALRDKKWTFGIVLIAMTSVMGINFGLISLDVANDMKDRNDYWLGIDKSDVIISVSDGATATQIESLLEGDDNISGIIPCRMNGILIVKREEGMKDNVVYPFIYKDYDEVEMTIIEGRNPQDGDEIALAGKIAETLQKDIGDYIELEFGAWSKSFLITGLYQTYYNMGESCRLTEDACEELALDFDTVSIYLKDKSDIAGKVERIGAIVGGNGKVIPRTEQFASVMEMIAKPQKSAIPIVMLMSILIGSVNIFCVIMLKNNKDQKMNGIYKCMGYTSGHLMSANVCYVSALALISILIAVPLLLQFYPQLMKMTLGMMFGLLDYSVEYNMLHVVVGNGIIFVFFLISTFISSDGIRKVNVRDLVID